MRFIMDIDLEAEPGTPRGDRMMMIQEMIEMIEMGLVEDFGRGAWGGYEGPFIETVRIRREGADGTWDRIEVGEVSWDRIVAVKEGEQHEH